MAATFETRTWCGLLLAAVTVTSGCDGCLFGECFPEDRPDTGQGGWETGGRPDTESPGTGSLEIAYTFEAGSCAAAGVSTLFLSLQGTTAVSDPIAFPCADRVLRLGEIAVDTYTVTVSAESASEVQYLGDDRNVDVTVDATASSSVAVACIGGGGGCP